MLFSAAVTCQGRRCRQRSRPYRSRLLLVPMFPHSRDEARRLCGPVAGSVRGATYATDKARHEVRARLSKRGRMPRDRGANTQ